MIAKATGHQGSPRSAGGGSSIAGSRADPCSEVIFARSCLCARRESPVSDDVGTDQGDREEEQAEDEEPDETVAFSPGHPGRPERDYDPDETPKDGPNPCHSPPTCY